jgi:NAD(P)-dependent dehydrogenase (short-subunit alcohol dehydrogenase family)
MAHENASCCGCASPSRRASTVAVGGHFDLTDHLDRPVSDATYRGRYRLVFFRFTPCRVVCPRALGNISAALEAKGHHGCARPWYGRLDVVVNNTGYGLLGAVEEVEGSQARQLFDTNFFGSLNVIQAMLPLLRSQRSGHIVNISSVGGFTSVSGGGLYSASKFALEGMSEALAAEVAPLGIRVTIVEPGAFRTDFLSASSLHQATRVIDDYAASSGKILEHFAQLEGKQPGDPVLAAKAIIEVVGSPKPPLRLVLGPDALERIRTKLKQVAEELDEWESVSRGTDYADANA